MKNKQNNNLSEDDLQDAMFTELPTLEELADDELKTTQGGAAAAAHATVVSIEGANAGIGETAGVFERIGNEMVGLLGAQNEAALLAMDGHSVDLTIHETNGSRMETINEKGTLVEQNSIDIGNEPFLLVQIGTPSEGPISSAPSTDHESSSELHEAVEQLVKDLETQNPAIKEHLDYTAASDPSAGSTSGSGEGLGNEILGVLIEGIL